ncbi:GMP synthase [Ignicoccus islandicus DSM 13165]|uniref:GMP synthase (glutamine-hydrolyzing) n=1 Tax=Ignicoccus islandicus DSM 13165 TaxID=940295 RepID=A0A0U3FIM8_9CREN|nr:ATP-binding protein [Ignicoccus islandicus]ALU11750.1 GMP synthase [Ignicoccus islandicus DSM 13165]
MFDPNEFIKRKIEEIRKLVGNEKVLAAVSGGVDSTTAAALAFKALGPEQIRVIFIDTGFMREGEPLWVKEVLKDVMPIEIVDASERFMKELIGKSDAEEKRKIFREIFYNVVSEEARKWGARWLVQGTTAPDWIETTGGIKTQHNVLEQLGINVREKWGFKLLEPLVELYKDEVRAVARALGLPEEIASRQPFPGPGLLVRCVGEVRTDKLQALRKATTIVEEKLKDLNPSQYFAAIWEDKLGEKIMDNPETYVFEGVKATGVKGDLRAYGPIALVTEWERPYEIWKEIITKRNDVTHVVVQVSEKKDGNYTLSIRAVLTDNFMTADVLKIDRSLLEEIAEEIFEKVPSIRRVVYDVTPKPPATIEYE